MSNQFGSIRFCMKTVGVMLLLCTNAPSQNEPSIRVNVVVSGDNQNTVSSYIKRELRSLGDVQISDQDPACVINISSSKVMLDDESRIIGHAISWSVDMLLDRKLESIFQDCSGNSEYTRAEISKIQELGTGLGIGVNLGLTIWVVPKDNLKSSCEEVVAQIDTDILEELRSGVYRILRFPSELNIRD